MILVLTLTLHPSLSSFLELITLDRDLFTCRACFIRASKDRERDTVMVGDYAICTRDAAEATSSRATVSHFARLELCVVCAMPDMNQ